MWLSFTTLTTFAEVFEAVKIHFSFAALIKLTNLFVVYVLFIHIFLYFTIDA